MNPEEHKRSSKSEIEDLIKARYSLIYVTSSEEARVEESLRKLCVEREMRLEIWSITEGFKTVANGQGTRDVKDPMKAIDHVMRAEGRALFVLRDFHPFLKEPAVVRRLRDAAHELRKTKKSMIMLSPVTKIPPELEKSIAAVMDWELPSRAEIEASARSLLPNAPPATQQEIESDPTFMERVVEAALGLTLVEAENVFAKSMVRTRTFDLETILEEKKQIIRKSGILEYYEHREEFSDVGGMEILKDWLVKRRNAFSSRARDFGLPLPKGILLIGVPGTGKSLTAKAVGALWQMPLLRLDMGKIFGGLVGSSEENMRNVIKTAEAIAPGVLWIDELEKGFSGTQSSGQTDGGTTSRVFGSFITWLQEKTTPVFVIATANNVQALPPELLRKGRFDEIFFCDLPDREDRRQIIDIHLRKKRRDPGQFDMDKLVDATVDYSGAELEQAVIAALYDAFDTGNDLDTKGLLQTIRDIVPLAVTMREQIDAMREWARTRARPASTRGSTANKGKGLGAANAGNPSWMARHGAPSGNLGDKDTAPPDESERKIEL
ncbi:MAG: AAA family ATPase [Kofleriaceae bacterium]|nr:AAA family ATPase [Kofleriaceae bacterium]